MAEHTTRSGLRGRDRRGRLVPAWVRYLLVGLAIGYLIALGHWGLVEVGAVARPPVSGYDYNDEEAWLAQRLDGILTGGQRRDELESCAVAGYGWPIHTLAALYGTRVIPNTGSLNPYPLVGVDVSRRWAAVGGAAGGDRYQRVLPVFPLIHQSALSAVLWGAAAWMSVSVMRWWRRRGDGIRRCTRCEYDLRGLPASGGCPECGTPR